VAGSLQRLGVDFGPRLMPATNANERGYYEHIDVVNLHDRLLLALGFTWDETAPLPENWWLDDARTGVYRAELIELLRRDFGASSLWGIKDPRLCRLLPWWESIWADLGVEPLFLIVLRRPEEIAASLVRREGFSSAKAHLLWLRHLLEAERWTRNRPRVFLDFETFLSDWAAALRPLEEALGQAWPLSPAQAQEANERFLDPTLRHARASASSDASLPLWVRQADEALRGKLAGRDAEMESELDRLRLLLREADDLYGPVLQARAIDLQQQIEAAIRQGHWYEQEWQKARKRYADARKRLESKVEQVEKQQNRIIELDNTISLLRKDIISKTRKQGVSIFEKMSAILRKLSR
jgi:hypothetical protein